VISLPIAPPPTPGPSLGKFRPTIPTPGCGLNRVGNVLTGFGSYDGSNGRNWAMTIAMPSQIYLGFAVASHNTISPPQRQL